MLREGGSIDLSFRPKFRITGNDRVRYLSGQVTQAVSDVSETQTLYACITNHKGKMEGDLFITGSNNLQSFLIDTDPALGDTLLARLDRYIIADDVEITEITNDWRLIHVIGDPPRIPNLQARSANRYGRDGTDYWIPVSDDVPEQLSVIPPLTESAVEIIRITSGVGEWGADLGPDILPPEAKLEDRAISYTKGCYIGQEVISRIRSVGRVNRTLETIESVDDKPLEPGMLLSTEEGKNVGTVTSAVLNPCHEAGARWIGLAFIKRDWAESGTRLTATSAPDESNAEQIMLSSMVEVRNNLDHQQP